MESAPLNDLFERYRRAGDAAALGEVFDRTAPELFRLAHHLVRDSAEAEDVLQATFVAAIERADTFDGTRPLTPWLIGILARQAGLARRRRARATPQPEFELAGDEDPVDAAERSEFSREFLQALRSLPEPYRGVLWRHLADGERPSKIAEELARAPGTVRMQIHRGLELLRRALPAGHAAGLAAFGSLRGLDAVRSEVLAAAPRHVPVGPGSGDSGPGDSGNGNTGTGGDAPASAAKGPASGGSSAAPWLAVPPSVLGLVLVAAIAGVAFWLAGDRSRNDGVPETSLANAVDSVGAGVGGESRGLSTGERVVAAADPSERRGALGSTAGLGDTDGAAWLAGTLVPHGVTELATAEIRVRGLARFALPETLDLRGHAGSDGEFRIELTTLLAAARPGRPIEELVVRVEHPRAAPTEVRVPLLFGADVTREASGERVFHTRIDLDAAGLIRGRVLPPPLADAAAGAAGESKAVALLFELQDGRPLLPAVDRRECRFVREPGEPDEPGDGTFVLRARSAAPHAVVIVARGAAPHTRIVEPVPGREMPLATIALEAGATIEGLAVRGGAPLGAGAWVSAVSPSHGELFPVEGARLAWDGRTFQTAGGAVETDADGRFVIEGLSAGAYRVGVSRAGPVSRTEPRRLALDASSWREVVAPCRGLELEASHARLTILVRAPGSAGPVRAHVRVEQPRANATPPVSGEGRTSPGSPAFTEAVVASDEAIEVSLEPSFPCRVTVSSEGCLPETRELDVAELGRDPSLVVSLRSDPAGARASVRLLLPAEQGAGPACDEAVFEVTALEDGRATGTPSLRRVQAIDGRFLVEGLSAGPCRLRAFVLGAYEHHRDHWCDATADVVLASGATLELELVLQRGGSLEVQAFRGARQPLAATLRIQRPGGGDVAVELLARTPTRSQRSATRSSEFGPAEVWPILAPGEYELLWGAPGFRDAVTRVRLVAGERTRASVLLEPEDVAR